MDKQVATIRTTRRARYHVLGKPGAHTRHLWFVLHGYGQLSEFFIDHFKPALQEDTVIVAPEALSRFYLGEEEWKRVGASWMTKEDRLNEISDQVEYLDTLLNAISEPMDMSKVCVTLLGFSQGGSTAWRWMMKGKIEPQNFVLWAGSIEGEEMERIHHVINHVRIWVTVGTRDQYISKEAAEAKIAEFKQYKPDLESIIFEDSHRIHEETLREIVGAIRTEQAARHA